MRPTLAILALSLSFLPALAAAQDAFDADGEEAMLERINALRAEGNLPALARTPTLDAVARGHSADMASVGVLGHVSASTGTPEDRVRRAGVGASAIAENVAFHRDAAQALQALIESPAHRGNLLSPAVSHIGLGAARATDGVYVTQVFAGMAAEQAPVESAAAPVENAAAPVASVAAPAPAPLAAAAAPAPAAPVAEAAPALPDPSSLFGIIPPFVEHFAGALLGPDAAEAAPPLVPAIASPAPEAPAAPSASSSTGAPAVDAATADTLRRLVGLAQSLLGGASTTPAN